MSHLPTEPEEIEVDVDYAQNCMRNAPKSVSTTFRYDKRDMEILDPKLKELGFYEMFKNERRRAINGQSIIIKFI